MSFESYTDCHISKISYPKHEPVDIGHQAPDITYTIRRNIHAVGLGDLCKFLQYASLKEKIRRFGFDASIDEDSRP